MGRLYRVLIQDPRLGRQVLGFHEHLGGSETSSIDDFLESNEEYREIGKLCIAATLTVWGPPSRPVRPSSGHWYRYLWERMREGTRRSDEFRENRVRIITYNYDTSLERYFGGVLEHAYPDLATDGHRAHTLRAEALPVLHLHGSLGEQTDRELEVPDRAILDNLQFYRRVAAGIRIIHDDKPTDEYAQAHRWLREAEDICFLGFGYHPTNVRRLDLLGQIRGRAGVFVGGTALGLERAEVQRAETLLAIGGPAQILAQDADALLYLRRYAMLQ